MRRRVSYACTRKSKDGAGRLNKESQHTQAVDEREVNGGAGRRLATEVEQRLWVEGQRPAQRVHPAEEAREDIKEPNSHFCRSLFTYTPSVWGRVAYLAVVRVEKR